MEIVYFRLAFIPEIKIKLSVFTNVNIYLIKHQHKMKYLSSLSDCHLILNSSIPSSFFEDFNSKNFCPKKQSYLDNHFHETIGRHSSILSFEITTILILFETVCNLHDVGFFTNIQMGKKLRDIVHSNALRKQMVNSGPRLTLLLKIKFYRNSAMPFNLCVAYHCFHASVAELNSCDRDLMAHKPKKIPVLPLIEKVAGSWLRKNKSKFLAIKLKFLPYLLLQIKY